MCPMPRSPVPTCGQHRPPELRIDALRAAHLLFSEIRPQIGTAPILMWMPEISLSPLRCVSGTHNRDQPRNGDEFETGRNSQARPGAFEISGTRLRTEVTRNLGPGRAR